MVLFVFWEDEDGGNLIFWNKKYIARCKPVRPIALYDLRLAGEQPYQYVVRESKFRLVSVAFEFGKLYIGCYIFDLKFHRTNITKNLLIDREFDVCHFFRQPPQALCICCIYGVGLYSAQGGGVIECMLDISPVELRDVCVFAIDAADVLQ